MGRAGYDTPLTKYAKHKSWSGNTRLSHVIRFCGIITLGPTFQKKLFLFRAFLKGPLNLKKHEGSSHKETGRHRRYRSAGFRDCVRKESRRHRRGYQRKDNQKVERRTPELEPQSQTQDYAQEETENHLPSRTISAKQSIRSTYRKKRRSKKRGN